MLLSIIVIAGGVAVSHHIYQRIQDHALASELSAAEEELRVFASRLAEPLDFSRSILDAQAGVGTTQLERLAQWVHERVVSDAEITNGQRIASQVGRVVVKANRHRDAAHRIQTNELVQMAVDVERVTAAMGSWMRVHHAYLQLWLHHADESHLVPDILAFKTDPLSVRQLVLKRFPYSPYRLVTYARHLEHSAIALSSPLRMVREEIDSGDPTKKEMYTPLADQVAQMVKDLTGMHVHVIGLDDYDRQLTLLQQEQDRERLIDIQNQKLTEETRSNRIKEDALFRLDRNADRMVSVLSDMRRDVKQLTEVVDRRLRRVEDCLTLVANAQLSAARSGRLPALMSSEQTVAAGTGAGAGSGAASCSGSTPTTSPGLGGTVPASEPPSTKPLLRYDTEPMMLASPYNGHSSSTAPSSTATENKGKKTQRFAGEAPSAPEMQPPSHLRRRNSERAP